MEKSQKHQELRDLELRLSELPKECEVYSRVVGYYRPIKQWNLGKREEWKDRKLFKLKQE